MANIEISFEDVLRIIQELKEDGVEYKDTKKVLVKLAKFIVNEKERNDIYDVTDIMHTPIFGLVLEKFLVEIKGEREEERTDGS